MGGSFAQAEMLCEQVRKESENNKCTAAGGNFQLAGGNGLAGQGGQLVILTQNQVIAIQGHHGAAMII